jgi:hypothetical protein
VHNGQSLIPRNTRFKSPKKCVVSVKRREKEKMCPGLGDRSHLT